ncbi:hypothetical protein PM082_016772 [Marasmius tenuissimus]|nr:hypothetical protein PM082_016772 [Marasmius tenuissimus]
MSMFSSASRTHITGGSFNIIYGTQNNNYPDSQSGGRSLVRIQPGEEWKEMLYQEYERISLGRIKLLRTVHHEKDGPPVGAKSSRRYIRVASRGDGRPEAERVVEIASISDPDGRDESRPLLTVKYTGRDAKKLFNKDCILFCRHRTTIMAQLRAFNDSRHIPVIIFNEELISVQHFLEYNRYSVQARCYLQLHARWQGPLLGDSSEELRAWVLSASKEDDLLHFLWFRPQTGALCFGPPGPPLDLNYYRYLCRPILENPLPRSYYLELPPSPLIVCNDTAFLDYIAHNVPDWLLVQVVATLCESRVVAPPHSGTQSWKKYVMTNIWKSCTCGGHRLETRRILKIPFGCWTHTPITGYSCGFVPPIEHEPYKEAENGGIRLLFTRSLRAVGFNFTSRSTREEYWLTQAGRVFSCLGIPRTEWASCSIITGFTLQLTIDDEESNAPEDLAGEEFNSPCYLFVSRPPKSPGCVPDIETWLRDEDLYYYSYDPEGGSAITKEERLSLGLPRFTSEVCARYACWGTEVYDFMARWQRAKGFDYTTTDYAEMFDLPILRVIPQDIISFEDLMWGGYEDAAVSSGSLQEYSEDNMMEVDSEFADMSDDRSFSSPDVDMDAEN